MRNKILVVGCGFAGATIARILADNSLNVHIIDKRNHIAQTLSSDFLSPFCIQVSYLRFR